MQGLVLSLLTLAAAVVARDCNGHAELCDRKYSNVTFAAAHNAAFVGESPSHNQFVYPEAQFDQGIRYFTTQTHDKDGVIEQCHTSCALLDTGAFKEILLSIKGKMDSSPDEVVTLLVTNDDSIDVAKYGDVFKDAGMDSYAYQPDGQPGLQDWPTLGELIDSGKRLVVFMDYHADTSKVPYILDEFTYYFETPFSPTEDNFYQCDINRPSGVSADGRMIFMNHNLNIKLPIGDILIPDQLSAADTNSIDSINKQASICGNNYGRAPNVVMLDFVDKGQTMDAQNGLNSL